MSAVRGLFFVEVFLGDFGVVLPGGFLGFGVECLIEEDFEVGAGDLAGAEGL